MTTLNIFLLSVLVVGIHAYTDIPCQWKSKTGATFDLRPLTVTGSKPSYAINDGDIPCTPEIERTYSFRWNFCADVTDKPEICENKGKGPASAYQFFHRDSDGYEECEVLGHYDPTRDDTYYRLLNDRDPSKGVSMTYLYGDKCPETKDYRTATINVKCANVKLAIESALEPNKCDYHIDMKSWYGCPQECPLTADGICSSHGHCAYDPVTKSPHCYCNAGYSGDDCGQHTSSSSSYDGLTVQVALLSTLLAIAVVLVGIVAYLAYRVSEFRKIQQYSQLSSQSEHGVEFGTISF